MKTLLTLSAMSLMVLLISNGTIAQNQTNKELKGYIMGFIDGALLTDSEIIGTIKRDDERLQGFLDRAYKTRLGVRGAKTNPSTVLAGFCLPESKDKSLIVSEVLLKIKKDDKSRAGIKKEISERVYATIKSLYPCK